MSFAIQRGSVTATDLIKILTSIRLNTDPTRNIFCCRWFPTFWNLSVSHYPQRIKSFFWQDVLSNILWWLVVVLIFLSFNSLWCKSYMTFSLIYPGLIPASLVFSYTGRLLAPLLRAFIKLMLSRHLKSFCYCKLYWRWISASSLFQLTLMEFLAEFFFESFVFKIFISCGCCSASFLITYRLQSTAMPCSLMHHPFYCLSSCVSWWQGFSSGLGIRADNCSEHCSFLSIVIHKYYGNSLSPDLQV